MPGKYSEQRSSELGVYRSNREAKPKRSEQRSSELGVYRSNREAKPKRLDKPGKNYLATNSLLCYSMYNKKQKKAGNIVIIEIDFNSDEAIYVQLCNQIIMGIATDQLKDGETLPSVRQLADTIGINMHTVNKAYSVLKQEGFLTIDRRKGAVISIDADKMRALEEMKQELLVVLARGCCRNVSREEVHALIDEIFDEYK